MAVPVAALAKLAAAALSDEDTRRKLGWIVAAICSPLILTLALICSLLSGSAEHNNSAVLLCFNGGNIPGKTPAEYVAYIEDMRRSFTLLDDAIAAVNDMTVCRSRTGGRIATALTVSASRLFSMLCILGRTPPAAERTDSSWTAL